MGDVAPISAAWPTFVAVDKGLFKAHGLDVTVTYAGSAAAAVQQLVGGAFDVGLSTFDSALRAAGAGAPVTVLGVTAIKYPYSLLVSPDINSVADLKGKTVILSFQKDIASVLWNRYLREQGIDPASVDQVYDGATPNRYAALSSKRVQGAFLGSPFDFRAQADGYRKLLDFGTYAKDIPFTVPVARRDWLAANPDTARRFLLSLSDAIAWLYDPANRDEAADILARNTKQPRDATLMTWDVYVNQLQMFSPGLALPPAAKDLVGGMLADLGDIKSVAAIPAATIDTSFLPR